MLNETGLHGATSIGDISDGKHMKRGMLANMIIYLSLYKVYLDIALERYADLCQEMSNKSNQL